MRKVIKQRFFKIGLVIALFIAIFGVTFTLNRSYIVSNTDMVQVVVASKKIPAFSKVGAESVTIKKLPRSVIPKTALTDTAVLEKKNLYTGDLGLGEGDVVREDRLTGNNDAPVGNLAKLQSENKMLVSIQTNLVKSCANLVTPGAVVNAVVFVKGDTLSGSDKIISPLEDPRLSNLLVVDKKNSESAPPVEKGREAIPAVITIMLDSQNIDVAKALVQYNEKGSIYLLPFGFKGDVYLAAQSVK